jgi:hypothetical protein
VNTDELGEHLDYSTGADAASHIDRQALSRELIGVTVDTPTRFSKSDFRKWHEHRVLAFIIERAA